MDKKKLREIKGEKIRWQYFTVPIVMAAVFAVFIPYMILVFSLYAGKFDMEEWLSGLWVCVVLSLMLALPFIVLSVLNRFFFGKIICVVNERGIYYEGGYSRWEDVVKIEYEIEFFGRYGERFCHAILHTKYEKVTLVHAPLRLLSAVKKVSPGTEARVSRWSFWMWVTFAAVMVLLVPIIPLVR